MESMAVNTTNQSLTAIVLGATGLTGSCLLELLLNDDRYDKVVTLSRKQIPQQHPKLQQQVANLFDPNTYTDVLKGDHLYICTGTTKAKTPDPKEYYRIEHDLPVQVAQVARQNNVSKVIVVSAIGASPDSKFTYNRGKGDMERDIENLGFNAAYFVQPALIGGDRKEQRSFESAWKKIQKLIDPLLKGSFKKYRTIDPETIAQSMIYLAVNDYKSVRIESDVLKTLALNYYNEYGRN
jgi:uncharacterized protein YbjT (DUF2867 family)